MQRTFFTATGIDKSRVQLENAFNFKSSTNRVPMNAQSQKSCAALDSCSKIPNFVKKLKSHFKICRNKSTGTRIAEYCPNLEVCMIHAIKIMNYKPTNYSITFNHNSCIEKAIFIQLIFIYAINFMTTKQSELKAWVAELEICPHAYLKICSSVGLSKHFSRL